MLTSLESLSARAASCTQRVSDLTSGLEVSMQLTLDEQVAQHGAKDAELHATLGGTSIYATGSVGRLEASEHSDLDVFVISGALGQKPLGKLQHYELITDLIRTARRHRFPPFSRHGAFLTSHPLADIVGEVGKPEDDYFNRFTARMLLLLESRCLFGNEAHSDAVAQVLGRYWPATETFWLPKFLINDLVRYWKTLCLNYEGFRRSDDTVGKRRLDLLKLRYSRMWTCFSALAFLLAGLVDGTIPRARALRMVSLTPAERMSCIAKEHEPTYALVKELLALYVAFLEFTGGVAKPQLEQQLEEQLRAGAALWSTFDADSDNFGHTMHQLMNTLAANSPIERFLLI